MPESPTPASGLLLAQRWTTDTLCLHPKILARARPLRSMVIRLHDLRRMHLSKSLIGTSMILMGNIDDNVSCNATISLDGSNYNFTSPAISTFLHQEAIWSSPTLPEGSHTFIYTIESCSNSSGNIWFDHILYNSTFSDGATYFVDDRDSLLQYSGNWEQAGGDGDFWHTRQGGRVGSSVKLDFQGNTIRLQ